MLNSNLLLLKSLLFLILIKRNLNLASPSIFWMPKGPKSFNNGGANESVHSCVALSHSKALCGCWLINLYYIPLGKGVKLKVIKHHKNSHPPWKLMKISLIGMRSEHRACHQCARERQEAANPFKLANHRERLFKLHGLVGSNYTSFKSGGGLHWGLPRVLPLGHLWTSFLEDKTAWELYHCPLFRCWKLCWVLPAPCRHWETKLHWVPTQSFRNGKVLRGL